MWFIAAVLWGSLSAQFLVQVVTSLIVAGVNLSALIFSRVDKSITVAGQLAGFLQVISFGVLFFAGNWFASSYINYGSWNADSVASLIAFLLTISYCAVQVPGKILLARLCAWVPSFAEAVNTQPANARVAFARKFQQDQCNEKPRAHAEFTARRGQQDQDGGRKRAQQLGAADRERIIQEYGALMERNPPLPTRIEDASGLPHPKTIILEALIYAIEQGHPKQIDDMLRIGAICLAQYQRDVGPVPLEMSETKHHDKFSRFDKLVQADLRVINNTIAAADARRNARLRN